MLFEQPVQIKIYVRLSESVELKIEVLHLGEKTICLPV